MKPLLLDAGNSRVRVKRWTGEDSTAAAVLAHRSRPLEPLAEYATADLVGDSNAWSLLRDLRSTAGNPPVVLVSVVPEVTRRLAALWPDLNVVDHRSRLPFPSLVDDLASVGPDRLCNVAAACQADLRDALIVDAGTATTFDLLEDGVFTGGLIAPGMAFAAEQLGRYAARLAPVAFASCPLVPGRDTRSAMAAGAWHVGLGGVVAVIRGLAASRPGLTVVLTGGLGHHLGALGDVVDRDWTLRGAAVLSGLLAI